MLFLRKLSKDKESDLASRIKTLILWKTLQGEDQHRRLIKQTGDANS